MDDPTLCLSAVGALHYVTLTRPDVAFAVNRTCQFMHEPTEGHWASVKHILRYLNGHTDHNVVFHRQSSHEIHVFSDADWACCPLDRRSTSGYALFFGEKI